MVRLAVIDDDPVEVLVIEGLLEHAERHHDVTAFTSVAAFLSEGGKDFDLVMLDRRIPPNQSFASSLEALSHGAYRGPVVLVTAGDCEETGMSWAGPLHGPVNKSELLTPEALERLIDTATAA